MQNHRELILSGKDLTTPKKCKEITKIKDGSSILHVDLSSNKLATGEGLDKFVGLKTLNLDNNGFTTLRTLPVLPKLNTLSLCNNHIEDLLDTVHYLKEKFPKLQYLNLAKNPVNPMLKNESEYEKYRKRMLKEFPNLKSLDGITVDSAGEFDDPLRAGFGGSMKSAPAERAEGKLKLEDEDKKAKLVMKKKKVQKTTIDNLSEKILKSHSEGNRFITNDDL